jgi:hypothetical protein
MTKNTDEKMLAEQLYTLWLQGSSLRSIGRTYGLSKDKVHSCIRKHYGKNACNLRMNSLQRSIIADYGAEYMKLASKTQDTPGLYWSEKGSKNQSFYYAPLEEAFAVCTNTDDEENIYLGFILFRYLFTVVEYLLATLLSENSKNLELWHSTAKDA